jgi:hypothetical protein
MFEVLVEPIRANAQERNFVAIGISVVSIVVIAVGGAFALLTILVMPVMLLLAIGLIPFGAASAIAGLTVEISVEAAPAGCWKVHQIQPSRTERLSSGLMHSVVYDDGRVIALLASWISQSKSNGPASSSDRIEV